MRIWLSLLSCVLFSFFPQGGLMASTFARLSRLAVTVLLELLAEYF